MTSNSSEETTPKAPSAEDLRTKGVARETFRAIYRNAPPWEIGRPQQAVVELLRDGAFRGEVLDVGCGTGENAIFLAAHGHKVVGIDFVSEAIEVAKQKAADRASSVTFLAHDALELGALDRRFDTVLDCGLFHVYSDADRVRYVQSLETALRSGGRLHLMCFSEDETRDGGPRRVTRREIESAFANGWEVENIKPIRFEATIYPDGARAWLATLARK